VDVLGAESSVTRRQSPRSSGTGCRSSVSKSMRSAWPGCAHRDASWSSRPVSAPTHSFSTTEHRRARSRRSAGLVLARAPEQGEAEGGRERGEEESPDPRGRLPSIVSARRAGRSRPPAARLPRRGRTRASRSAGPFSCRPLGSASANSSVSPRSAAWASMRAASSGSAVTVTPRSIAKAARARRCSRCARRSG
jgi:hypothetical protein